MFGYVSYNSNALGEADEKRFKALYCGLCRTLRLRHGVTGRMTLSYDMTFLLTLLSSLYEPEEESGAERCVRHPKKPHDYAASELSDYAADMTVALSYQKCLDNWSDDRSLAGRAGARLLRTGYEKVKAQYPRQCAAIEKGLDTLGRLEASGQASLDAPVNCFGEILGEIFVWKEDLWADSLRRTGEALGRFIYLCDAYDDLDEDIRKKRFNPLKELAAEADFDERCRVMLEVLISDGTRAFEELPLVKDLDLLRNILYSGIWARFASRRAKRTGSKEAGKHD